MYCGASPLGSRLAKGAFWALAGAVISRGLALLSSIIVARFLGKEGFGELGIIQSTIGMFGVFAGFGLGLTATKHVAEFRVKNPSKAGRILSLSTIVAFISGGLMALILLVLSPWLASHTLAAPHLNEYLQIAAGVLFLSALTGTQTGALSGFGAFKTIANVNLWAGIANFPLMVGGVYIAGLKGALWGLVAGIGVNWLLNNLALKAEVHRAGVPLAFMDCGKEWKVLWSFSVPAFLSGTMVYPVIWICNAMLVNQPNGYAEMGIFNAANQWRQFSLFLPGILMQAILPSMSENNGGVGRNARWLQIKLMFWINLVIGIPLFLFLCILSPLIMGSYGSSFRDSWPVLVFTQGSAFLQAIQSPVVTFWAATGEMWKNFFANIGWGVAVTGFTWLLISGGATGLALALLISFALYSLLMLFVVYYSFLRNRT